MGRGRVCGKSGRRKAGRHGRKAGMQKCNNLTLDSSISSLLPRSQSHAGKKVVGRIWWPSNPINIGPPSKGGIGHVPDYEGESFKEKKGKGYDERGNVTNGESEAAEFSIIWVLVGGVLITGALIAARRKKRRAMIKEYEMVNREDVADSV